MSIVRLEGNAYSVTSFVRDINADPDEPYEGRSCAKCVLYVGHGECVIVEGEVSPNGWCMQWTPATMGRRDEPFST